MPRITSFTSRGLTVAVKLGVAADTSLRAPATLGPYGPNDGVYIPGAIVVSTTNFAPDGLDRNYVFTGKNSLGSVVTAYTPNSVMGFVYTDAATLNSGGYGNNAFVGASAFGTIPSNYSSGAPIRDLINTNGVVTVEVSWTGMTAPFIINLTS